MSAVIDLKYVACSGCHRLGEGVIRIVHEGYQCTACGLVEDFSRFESRAIATKHAFVRGAEGGPYRVGPPDETCARCQCDPRNSIHDVGGDVLTLAPDPPTEDAAPDSLHLTGDEAKAYRRFAAAKAASIAAQRELAKVGTELRDAFAEMCRVEVVP